MIQHFLYNLMISQTEPLPFTFPTIQKLEADADTTKFKRITLVHPNSIQEVQGITPQNISDFNSRHKVTVNIEDVQTTYLNFLRLDKEKIQLKSKVIIDFASDLESHLELAGALSTLLSSSYQFSLKTLEPPKEQPKVYYTKDSRVVEEAIELARSKSYARQLANQRANVGTTEFMEQECRRVATQCGLEIIVVKDDMIKAQNLNLLDAVGRASIYKPRLVNLSYRGNPTSEEWIALVGKGLCFDSGGLNIKTTSGMLGMHLDKHGSCSVLAAIRAISKLKLKVNVTASFGFAENSINQNAFRPSDIIKSKNGLTVEIGNTDAQGRLTLADTMTWTLQKYTPSTLIQLSTLTGAIVTALGNNTAGLFTNNQEITKQLLQAGNTSRDKLWHMPIFDEHRDMVKGKAADLTNASGKSAGSSCQAAAFLQYFVPKDVKWAHIDIAGSAMADGFGTGHGSRLLVKYVQSKSQSN